LIETESQESPSQALEKALIFMIDAYSDSGIIEQDEVVIMLKDILKYYQRSTTSVALQDK
jgi:hypothetical protein